MRGRGLYEAPKARRQLKDGASATFLDVTDGPLADNDEEVATSGTCTSTSARFRLYRGATPDSPVGEMFSFIPATAAARGSVFTRPLVDIRDKYFNPKSTQAPKGQGICRGYDELLDLWNGLVKQVRAAGLALATHAALPPRRQAK